MHSATVEALSVRKDGTGFKANLPGKGEQWLSLPQNMTGRVEWKKTYTIGWTESPGAKGTFFNVKELNDPAPKVVNVAGETFVRPSMNGHGNGSEKDRFIFMCGIMNRAVQAGKVAINSGAIELAIREIYRGYDAALSTPQSDLDFADDVGETFR